MEYFQFDILRTVAGFVCSNDLKNIEPKKIRDFTGLQFAAPETHSPWRNYSRIFKLCLLLAEVDGKAVPTDIARVLTEPGLISCDEYIHFLVEATTDPSPALSGWNRLKKYSHVRYPLIFSLKYVLARVAGFNESITPLNEIIDAYNRSGFTGHENDEAFLAFHTKRSGVPKLDSSSCRQARESLKFISQISYLHCERGVIVASISQGDAMEVFHALSPVGGILESDGNAEILRLASYFKDGSTHDFFDFPGSVLSNELESGFEEGTKAKKTHIVIERNTKLREYYFKQFPTATCNTCRLNTGERYPWTDRVLDLHHLLPLSSGTRVESSSGTLLEDLVAICPTCHRAVHRYYDQYLKSSARRDFIDKQEAHEVYQKASEQIDLVAQS